MSNSLATRPGQQRSFHPQLRLLVRLVLRCAVILAAAILILFSTAGTWADWQAWMWLCVLFVPLLCGYAWFFKTDPRFLETRLEDNEPAREQKVLIRWSGSLFLLAFLLPGLDYRFGWSRHLHLAVPLWLIAFSLAMTLAAVLLVLWAMNVNRFAAHTIQVVAGQSVIANGPYRFVRHPLYTGAAALWFFMPLALGSSVTLPAFMALESFYVLRLLNEEKILFKSLPGYTEYCARTRYHLIPFVW